MISKLVNKLFLYLTRVAQLARPIFPEAFNNNAMNKAPMIV